MHGHGKEAAACLCAPPSALDFSTTFSILHSFPFFTG